MLLLLPRQLKSLFIVLLLTLGAWGQSSISIYGTVRANGQTTIAPTGNPAPPPPPPVFQITTTSVPSDTAGVLYPGATIQTVNGVGAVSCTPNPSGLPPGMTLSSTCGLAGTPATTDAGDYSFTATATDSNTPTPNVATQLLAIKITCSGVQLITPALPNGTQGQNYSLQLTTQGGVTPITFTETGTLPTNITVSPTGLISGAPSNSGTFASITLTATDSCPTPGAQTSNGASPYSLTIIPNSGPLAFSTTSPLISATIESPSSQSLVVTGGTPPYTFTEPSGSLPLPMTSGGLVSGTVEDMVDWIMMDARRNTQHPTGNANPHYDWIDQDGIKLWSLKGSGGNPWDIYVYGTFGLTNACPNDANGNPQYCHWMTENGDENAFTNPKAYKRFVTPVPLAPRFFVDGTTATIVTAGNNPIHRTLNCELDGEPIINIGTIKAFMGARDGVSPGPETVAWGGSVGTQPTITISYYYTLSGGIYQARERFSYVKFWGLVNWDVSSWNGSSYTVNQTTTAITLSSGGSPTPNFPCGPSIPGWIGGNTGTPQAANQKTSTPAISSTATVQVADSASHTASRSFTLAVNPRPISGIISNSLCGTATGGMDATAHLPLTYLCSAEANTPRSGAITSVPNGTSLQTAYNNASCGDWLQLAAGGNYSITTLAGKNCLNSQWIWITTAPSSNLPPEGTTTSPCYSNVTSLADYGSLNCATSGAFTAKITVSTPISIDTADHIRFENLEIAKASGPIVYNLFQSTTGGNNLVFDRLWIHGNPNEEVSNGIQIVGSSNLSIVENYFSDLHCISGTGSCSEGHAIAGDSAPGPFKISHNRLSAGGQYILFGGGSYTYGTPSDIEISYNHGFRPFVWNSGCTTNTSCPGGVIYNGGAGGHPYVVKNDIEFKNAQRVLIQGNEWQNVWSGFSQVGNAITITPKNQGSGTSNLCPQCFTVDITERYDWITYFAEVFQISNVANGNGAFASAGNSYSFHDILADHAHYVGCGGCAGYTWQTNADSNAPTSDLLSGLTFNHITLVLDGFTGTSLMFAGGPLAPQGSLVIQNSILPTGNYGIVSGGAANKCAFPQPASVPELTACFSPLTFTNNGIPFASGTSCGGGGCGGNWGTGQIKVADQNAVGYTNLITGNYQLQTTSQFHNQATDGTDLGANIPILNSYLANTAP